MAAFEKKEAFIKQISIFLKNQDYKKAYVLGKEFVAKYPLELSSRYLMGKSCFWLGKYEEAAEHAVKAYELAAEADRIPCCILAASAYYQLGEYQYGHDMLGLVKGKHSQDLERLRMAFAVAMGNKDEAKDIFDQLYRINKNEARKLLEKMLG